MNCTRIHVEQSLVSTYATIMLRPFRFLIHTSALDPEKASLEEVAIPYKYTNGLETGKRPSRMPAQGLATSQAQVGKHDYLSLETKNQNLISQACEILPILHAILVSIVFAAFISLI